MTKDQKNPLAFFWYRVLIALLFIIEILFIGAIWGNIGNSLAIALSTPRFLIPVAILFLIGIIFFPSATSLSALLIVAIQDITFNTLIKTCTQLCPNGAFGNSPGGALTGLFIILCVGLSYWKTKRQGHYNKNKIKLFKFDSRVAIGLLVGYLVSRYLFDVGVGAIYCGGSFYALVASISTIVLLLIVMKLKWNYSLLSIPIFLFFLSIWMWYFGLIPSPNICIYYTLPVS